MEDISKGLTEIAATRRGCVTPITFPSVAQPASSRYWKEPDEKRKVDKKNKGGWDGDTDVAEQQHKWADLVQTVLQKEATKTRQGHVKPLWELSHMKGISPLRQCFTFGC